MNRVADALRRATRSLRRRFVPNALERRVAGLGLGPGDVAIDCGANVGVVTVALARTGAEVYAFEPNPDAFGELASRIGARGNIHLYPQAVLDRDEAVRLYLHRNADDDPVGWSGGSSVLPYKGNVNPDAYVEVEAVDLAPFVLELDREVKLVKIDVEGAECRIVDRLIDAGAMDRIGTGLLEVHDGRVPELRDETDRLRERLRDEGLADKVRTDWI